MWNIICQSSKEKNNKISSYTDCGCVYLWLWGDSGHIEVTEASPSNNMTIPLERLWATDCQLPRLLLSRSISCIIKQAKSQKTKMCTLTFWLDPRVPWMSSGNNWQQSIWDSRFILSQSCLCIYMHTNDKSVNSRVFLPTWHSSRSSQVTISV